jgi:two-component system sensor histidine kinase VicK
VRRETALEEAHDRRFVFDDQDPHLVPLSIVVQYRTVFARASSMDFGVNRPIGSSSGPWRLAIAAVVGLLALTVVDGLVSFALTWQVEQITDEALHYDIELEDEGDDLRVAVLDVRHYHRNLHFTGASRGAIADFERAYADLQEEIDELSQIGVREADAPQPDQIRALAERYYADVRLAIDRYDVDRGGFIQASDRGLQVLATLGAMAEDLDGLGEERAEAALTKIEQATATARMALLGVLGGVIVIGVVLAYSAVRMVGELRGLHVQQQAVAEALAETSRAKTDFLADVSHELRTPLTVLRGNAEVGLELVRDCVHTETLQEIVKVSARMSRMVEDLLFLARTDSSSPLLDLQRVDLEPFLAELAARAAVLTRERGATFGENVAGVAELRIDPARIEQAVLIMVDNAARYGPPGGRVTLSAGTTSDEVWIEVADQGPGIPQSELPHVFERFYRVGNRRQHRPDGAGLGLAIAKTIVDAHGGRIQAISRVGEGTRMMLSLPFVVPSTSTPDTPRSVLSRR